MNSIFAELRNDHHDDEMNCIVIEGWKPADDNEQGTVVARICLDTYKVWWTDQLYANDASCKAIVQETIAEAKAAKVQEPVQLIEVIDDMEETLRLFLPPTDMDYETACTYVKTVASLHEDVSDALDQLESEGYAPCSWEIQYV